MSFKDAHFHRMDPKAKEFALGQLELAKDQLVRQIAGELKMGAAVIMLLTPVLPLRILGALLLGSRVLFYVLMTGGINAHIDAIKGEGDSDA